MRALQRYLGMSARAATIVTVAAVLLFTAFGSFHWRLWWLVPPVWLALFILSMILAPVMRVEPGKGWTSRLPWLGLVTLSLLALGAVSLGIEAEWTRLTLALLAAAGLGAGVYGSRTVLPIRHGARERRRNFALRARTDELLDAIRQMHRVAVQLDGGQIAGDRANRSLDEIEGRLRGLLSEIRQSAVRGLSSTADSTGGEAGAAETPATPPSERR
jgi:hypothetical protein